MLKSSIFSSILLLAFILGGCKSQEVNPPVREYPVKVAEVVTRSVPVYIDTIGNVTAVVTAQLRAQISGKLQQVHVAEGAFVKKGDLLYTIEPDLFQAAVDSAAAALQKDEALLVLAKETRDRYSKLVTQDYVSKLNYDQYVTNVATTEAQVALDKAALDTARINLGYAFIHAPWDGKIGSFNVDPGNLVSPTDTVPLTDLRQITPIEVDFSITQEQYEALQAKGPTKNYPVEALLPGEVEGHEGTIFFFDNHVDVTTGTILVKAYVPNEDLALWPGEFARVRILLNTLENALLVPSIAVQIGQQGKYVYVLKPDQTVELRTVKEAGREGGFTILSEGVKLGETVITDGQINLKKGVKVKIVKPATSDSP